MEKLPLILWLAILPPDEFKKITDNMSRQYELKEFENMMAVEVDSLSGAICAAITWHLTPEGSDYWWKLYMKYE